MNDAIKAYEGLGCDYKLVTYAMMIGISPFINGCYAAGTHISFLNPLQGLLFHWIIVNFFVYGCEQKYFKFKGLSMTAAEGSTSECAQVRQVSAAKYKELVDVCNERRITIPNFNKYFFKFKESKVILEADRQASIGIYDSEFAEDEDDDFQEGDDDDGDNLKDSDEE